MDRSGWKTTEFWMGLAAIIVGYLVSSDLGDESTWLGKGLAIIAMALASFGYSISRARVKGAKIIADGK
jgi:hypothetical protein